MKKKPIWILSFDVANLQALQLCHILNIKWYFLVKDENLISIQYYLYYILSRWCWQYLKNIKKRAITVIVKNGVILQFFSSIRMAPFGSLRSKKRLIKNTFFSPLENHQIALFLDFRALYDCGLFQIQYINDNKKRIQIYYTQLYE